jgi:hypothetical protein
MRNMGIKKIHNWTDCCRVNGPAIKFADADEGKIKIKQRSMSENI